MAEIFTHIPHPRVVHRSVEGPSKVEDQFSTAGPLARFNTSSRSGVTAAVGTM